MSRLILKKNASYPFTILKWKIEDVGRLGGLFVILSRMNDKNLHSAGSENTPILQFKIKCTKIHFSTLQKIVQYCQLQRSLLSSLSLLSKQRLSSVHTTLKKFTVCFLTHTTVALLQPQPSGVSKVVF